MIIFSLSSVSDNDCVHEVDGIGRTALMYAVHSGHLDNIQTLLHYNADVNATAHGKSAHENILKANGTLYLRKSMPASLFLLLKEKIATVYLVFFQ